MDELNTLSQSEVRDEMNESVAMDLSVCTPAKELEKVFQRCCFIYLIFIKLLSVVEQFSLSLIPDYPCKETVGIREAGLC